MVNNCRVRGRDGGSDFVAIFRGLPDGPGTYGNAAAYAYPAAYVCANGCAAPDDRANGDAAPDACANSDAAAYANSDASPDGRANFGIHTQHPKRPVG